MPKSRNKNSSYRDQQYQSNPKSNWDPQQQQKQQTVQNVPLGKPGFGQAGVNPISGSGGDGSERLDPNNMSRGVQAVQASRWQPTGYSVPGPGPTSTSKGTQTQAVTRNGVSSASAYASVPKSTSVSTPAPTNGSSTMARLNRSGRKNDDIATTQVASSAPTSAASSSSSSEEPNPTPPSECPIQTHLDILQVRFTQLTNFLSSDDDRLKVHVHPGWVGDLGRIQDAYMAEWRAYESTEGEAVKRDKLIEQRIEQMRALEERNLLDSGSGREAARMKEAKKKIKEKELKTEVENMNKSIASYAKTIASQWTETMVGSTTGMKDNKRERDADSRRLASRILTNNTNFALEQIGFPRLYPSDTGLVENAIREYLSGWVKRFSTSTSTSTSAPTLTSIAGGPVDTASGVFGFWNDLNSNAKANAKARLEQTYQAVKATETPAVALCWRQTMVRNAPPGFFRTHHPHDDGRGGGEEGDVEPVREGLRAVLSISGLRMRHVGEDAKMSDLMRQCEDEVGRGGRVIRRLLAEVVMEDVDGDVDVELGVDATTSRTTGMGRIFTLVVQKIHGD